MRRCRKPCRAACSDVRSAALSPLNLVKGLFGGKETEIEKLRRRVAELEALLEDRKRRRK